MINYPKIGLVLGAGGPKGLAHIGAIKALTEHNVPISAVSGTSMGALVGALYCYRGDILEVEEFANKCLKTSLWKIFFDPHIFKGLIKGDKIHDLLNNYLEDCSFSQLKIPLAIVASDLITGEKIVFTQGSVLKAIRSSISVPFLLKPVDYREHILVDGALHSPLPVGEVKALGVKKTIAVSLFNDFDYSQKINKLGYKEIWQRTVNIMIKNLALEEEKQADVVIRPHVQHVGWKHMFNQNLAKEIINEGYKATNVMLPEIKKLSSLSFFSRFFF